MQVVGFEKAQQPQPPITITVYPQYCLRCSFRWNSHKPRPVMCPSCKIRKYDKPRKFFRSGKERNKQYVSSQLDKDRETFRLYPFMIKDEQERKDTERRDNLVRAMSQTPDSAKKRYPCFNAFFTYPYPMYQKGAS